MMGDGVAALTTIEDTEDVFLGRPVDLRNHPRFRVTGKTPLGTDAVEILMTADDSAFLKSFARNVNQSQKLWDKHLPTVSSVDRSLYETLLERPYPPSNKPEDVFVASKCHLNCAWAVWLLNGRTLKAGRWQLAWSALHCALVNQKRKIIDPTTEFHRELAPGDWKSHTVAALCYESFGTDSIGLPTSTLEEMRSRFVGSYAAFLDAAATAEAARANGERR